VRPERQSRAFQRREEEGRRRERDQGRGFNALSWASQVHFSGNSRDTAPIRPTTNQVLCPQNTTRIDKTGVSIIIRGNRSDVPENVRRLSVCQPASLLLLVRRRAGISIIT